MLKKKEPDENAEESPSKKEFLSSAYSLPGLIYASWQGVDQVWL